MTLRDLAKKDPIKPFGEIEVLLYYRIVAEKLKRFLKNKEISAKVLIPNGPQLLKRGSQLEPLFIEEFIEGIDENFLKLRKEIKNLNDAQKKVTKVQYKIWSYFLPRKLSDFFYATNKEGQGKNIDRIFYDIDRGDNVTKDDARKATSALIKVVKADKEFKKIIGDYKIFTMYTGSSFHVYLMLEKEIKNEVYNKYIHYSKNASLESFTGRWTEQIKKESKIKVIGGHEKLKGFINIDPSQTPSGKLGRCPFSLHMKDAKTIDGVAVPLKEEMLEDKNLVKKLEVYNPKKVIDELDELGKRIS